MEGDNQFVDEGNESSPNDRFESVVAATKSTPFTLTIQWEDHSIILLSLPHSHLGDKGITNIFSDVLIEFSGQKTTIGDTTYDELALLVAAGLIDEQKSSCPIVVAHYTSIHTFDVKQIIFNA